MPTEKREEQSVEIQKIFDAWKKHRPSPNAVILTEARKKVIRARLADGFSADQLALVVGDYAHLADTNEARFWRGENQQGTEYLDLSMNLLRPQKIAKRVENALAWKAGGALVNGEFTEDASIADVPDVNLGWQGVFHGHPPPAAAPAPKPPARPNPPPPVATQPVRISTRGRR